MDKVSRVVKSSFSLDDGFGELFVDFVVARHGLGFFSGRVGVPIVTAAMTGEDAAHLFEFADQLAASPSATANSSTFRM